jgi:hypothetical protein
VSDTDNEQRNLGVVRQLFGEEPGAVGQCGQSVG